MNCEGNAEEEVEEEEKSSKPELRDLRPQGSNSENREATAGRGPGPWSPPLSYVHRRWRDSDTTFHVPWMDARAGGRKQAGGTPGVAGQKFPGCQCPLCCVVAA